MVYNGLRVFNGIAYGICRYNRVLHGITLILPPVGDNFQIIPYFFPRSSRTSNLCEFIPLQGFLLLSEQAEWEIQMGRPQKAITYLDRCKSCLLPFLVCRHFQPFHCSHGHQGNQHPPRRHLHAHHARPGKPLGAILLESPIPAMISVTKHRQRRNSQNNITTFNIITSLTITTSFTTITYFTIINFLWQKFLYGYITFYG